MVSPRRWGRHTAVTLMTWACVAAIVVHYVLFPVVEAWTGKDLPAPDGGAFTPVLLAVLGAGGLRAVENGRRQ